MFAIDDWKLDLSAGDHMQRLHLAKTSLQRNFQGDSQRRVTRSSTSSSTAVVDCCWVRGHRTGATPTASTALSVYLFCALSGGAVCLLNTANLSKTYLFENDSSRRGHRDDNSQRKDVTRQHRSRWERLVAIDSVLLHRRGQKESLPLGGMSSVTQAAAADDVLAVVCAAAEGSLCVFTVEADGASHARSSGVKTGAVQRTMELPPDDILAGKGRWERTHIRFSPKGRRIVAVASARIPCSSSRATATTTAAASSSAWDTRESVEYVTLFSILKWKEGEGPEMYTVEKSWTRVVSVNSKTSVELLHVAWWDDDDSLLLLAWSDGVVSLMNVDLETVAHTCIFLSQEERAAQRVSMATSVSPTNQSKGGGSGGRVNAPQQLGLVAMVMDHNIIIAFTVHESSRHRGSTTEKEGERPLKSVKHEQAKSPTEPRGGLTLRPGNQTYCSEDIPVCDIALFDNFIPYTLAVLLQSGALLALDTVNMELLYHRPFRRFFPERGEIREVEGGGKKGHQTNGKHHDATRGSGLTVRNAGSADGGINFFLRPKEKPMGMCVVEHNIAVFLHPS